MSECHICAAFPDDKSWHRRSGPQRDEQGHHRDCCLHTQLPRDEVFRMSGVQIYFMIKGTVAVRWYIGNPKRYPHKATDGFTANVVAASLDQALADAERLLREEVSHEEVAAEASQKESLFQPAPDKPY